MSPGRHRSPLATIGVVGSRHELPCQLQPAARNLHVELHRLDVPTVGRDGDDLRNNDPPRQQLVDELLARAAHCDVVTFDRDTVTEAHLAVLAATGIDLRPNRQSFLLTCNPEATTRALHDCGFDVVSPADQTLQPQRPSPVDTLTILVIRRPSGHVVAHSTTAACAGIEPGTAHPVARTTRDRAIESAVAIANGLDVAGALTVNFLVDAGRSYIHDVSLGPNLRPPAVWNIAHVRNHLRALLDWPLDPPKNPEARRTPPRTYRSVTTCTR